MFVFVLVSTIFLFMSYAIFMFIIKLQSYNNYLIFLENEKNICMCVKLSCFSDLSSCAKFS